MFLSNTTFIFTYMCGEMMSSVCMRTKSLSIYWFCKIYQDFFLLYNCKDIRTCNEINNNNNIKPAQRIIVNFFSTKYVDDVARQGNNMLKHKDVKLSFWDEMIWCLDLRLFLFFFIKVEKRKENLALMSLKILYQVLH